ncbi:hypothetical protein QBC41DRAFT_368000 [Cercophora samala]|uniref:Zn(2)-C6 fungal-type domain-containing protein n=1 Tax=Cercophora samala TaxID=330535 RepID=A0AA39Z4D5_9PEZI|nr:hypothetical protein QBC41DRAFT_368000 [Cercophora samala]
MSGSPSSDATSPSRPRLRRNRKRKTCIPCARSKRKCDQSMPWCRRCVEKEIVCTYPPRRGGPMPAFTDEVALRPLTEPGNTPGASSTSASDWFGPDKGKHPQIPQARTDFDSNYSPLSSPYQWFLSPGSWRHFTPLDADIMSLPPELEVAISQDSLPNFIQRHQQWLRLWAKDGHSPLLHRHLYRDLMPECIRDAYTSRAAYDLAGTAAAKGLALSIIQDRATELIQSQPDFHANHTSNDNPSLPSGSLDASNIMLGTFHHLARTQSLFVYEITQLFDGDIRSRDQAESYMETLHRWACQMLESARLDCTTGEVFGSYASSASSAGSSPSGNNDWILGTGAGVGTSSNTAVGAITPPSSTHNPFALPPNPAPHTLWQVWVIAESVRRTYISVSFVRSVYQTIKTQWSACPGGALFSGLGGLWDATTGKEWCAALRKGNAARSQKASEDGMSPWALMQSLEVWKVLEYAVPDEVDEFTVAVAEISRGMEVVEQWMMEKSGTRGSGSTNLARRSERSGQACLV